MKKRGRDRKEIKRNTARAHSEMESHVDQKAKERFRKLPVYTVLGYLDKHNMTGGVEIGLYR